MSKGVGHFKLPRGRRCVQWHGLSAILIQADPKHKATHLFGILLMKLELL